MFQLQSMGSELLIQKNIHSNSFIPLISIETLTGNRLNDADAQIPNLQKL